MAASDSDGRRRNAIRRRPVSPTRRRRIEFDRRTDCVVSKSFQPSLGPKRNPFKMGETRWNPLGGAAIGAKQWKLGKTRYQVEWTRPSLSSRVQVSSRWGPRPPPLGLYGPPPTTPLFFHSVAVDRHLSTTSEPRSYLRDENGKRCKNPVKLGTIDNTIYDFD